ncbi:MAG: hypothetical protein C3F02_02925 [Parcubacteria group bacterium]|nr:MAG: hypothetical protein C3F02_02925 [Parcubacteria group bacterium]
MEINKLTSRAILTAVQQATNILVIAHKKPDGDTLGSNLAFTKYLLSVGKKFTSFCLHPAPSHLAFLPNSHLISNDHLTFSQTFDLVILLDSSNLEYAGVDKLMTALRPGYKIINIDHHVSNTMFGDINLVIYEASSTAEVVYRLFKDWDIDWSAGIASCLACGMITDTGGFKNPATNYITLLAASDLKSKGANIHQITKQALGSTKLNNLRLWGRALERLRDVPHYNLIYTWLTEQDFTECATDESAVDGLSNFLHIIKEGKIIMVLRQSKVDTIKGSLRTTSNIDLTKIAEIFGGGGHKKAAGFSLSGRLECNDGQLIIK